MVDQVNDCTARARRWAEGWELHIDGMGVTQSRTLASAERQVADYVETLTGVRPNQVSITVEGLRRQQRAARAAHRATARAEELQRSAAAANRSVARELRDAGLSVSDTAYLMGFSRGRISQLTK